MSALRPQPVQCVEVVLAGKRRTPGQHLIQDRPQAVNVGFGSDLALLRFGLFGGHKEGEPHAIRDLAAALPGDEHLRAGRAFRIGQSGVLFDDEGPAHGHHHQHADDAPRPRPAI